MTSFLQFEHDLYSSGQPTAEELAHLASRGVRSVINLRSPAEPVDFDERAEVARLGMHYESIPVAGAADLHARTLAQFSAAVESARAAGPVLIHCGSGNRVGALVALHAGLRGGLAHEDALQAGRDAGLTALEPTVASMLSVRSMGDEGARE